MPMKYSKTKTVATHSGTFHADDCFGTAVLLGLFPSSTLIRTRDRNQIANADFAVDVGGIWDPATGRFDHHQTGFDGARPSYVDKEGNVVEGTGYASAGLVWREYGNEYVRMVAKAKCIDLEEEFVHVISESVDLSLVRFIDLVDTGKSSVSPGVFGLSSLLAQLNIDWMDERGLDSSGKADLHMERFKEAMAITQRFLDQVILRKISQIKASTIVRAAKRLLDGKVLFLKEGGMPWTRIAVEEMPDVLLVVYPDSDGNQFQVHTVPSELGAFRSRMDLPASWSGLRDEEMAAVTGVKDSVFCHTNLFIGGAKSLDGCLELCRLALVSAGFITKHELKAA